MQKTPVGIEESCEFVIFLFLWGVPFVSPLICNTIWSEDIIELSFLKIVQFYVVMIYDYWILPGGWELSFQLKG